MGKIGTTLILLGIVIAIKTCALAAADVDKTPLYFGIALIVLGVAINYMKLND
jgi:hypothetical protein